MDYREAIEEQQALDREYIAAEEAAIRSEWRSAWEAESDTLETLADALDEAGIDTVLALADALDKGSIDTLEALASALERAAKRALADALEKAGIMVK